MKIEMQSPLGILMKAETKAEHAIFETLNGKTLAMGATKVGVSYLALSFPEVNLEKDEVG